MSRSDSHFVYLKLPRTAGDAAGADDHRVAIALERVLGEQGLGSVMGWGDSLGARRPVDGRRAVAFQRVDIAVADLAAALPALHRALDALGVPPGTEIHYRRDEQPLLDLRGDAGWQQALPSPA